MHHCQLRGLWPLFVCVLDACSSGPAAFTGPSGGDAAPGAASDLSEAAAANSGTPSADEAGALGEPSPGGPAADASAFDAGAVDFSSCPPNPVTGDFPLDVAAVLHAKCQTCHHNPPSGHAPFSLLNYEDVMVPLNGAPRWQDMYRVIQPGSIPHMPPGNAAPLTAAELQPLSHWLGACAQPVPEGTGGDSDSSGNRDAASPQSPPDGASD